jgi:hypothetical protein
VPNIRGSWNGTHGRGWEIASRVVAALAADSVVPCLSAMHVSHVKLLQLPPLFSAPYQNHHAKIRPRALTGKPYKMRLERSEVDGQLFRRRQNSETTEAHLSVIMDHHIVCSAKKTINFVVV